MFKCIEHLFKSIINTNLFDLQNWTNKRVWCKILNLYFSVILVVFLYIFNITLSQI